MTLLPDLELDAAVLRHAALGDVELRHDLEARDERRLELQRRLHDFLQRAVDAVAHAQLVLEALEVDVRRAALHGVGEDRVDELDDRRVIHLRRRAPRPTSSSSVSSTTSMSPSHALGDVLEQRRPSARRRRFVVASRSTLRSVNSPAMTGKMS